VFDDLGFLPVLSFTRLSIQGESPGDFRQVFQLMLILQSVFEIIRKGMDPKGSDCAPRNGNGYEKTHPSKLGAIGELPILRYGKVTNYEEFERKLVIYAEREYGLLGTLFNNMQYYTPPLIEEAVHYVVEDFDPENDPLGLHKATLLEEMKARTKLVVDMQTKRTALFAVVWGQLSQESLRNLNKLSCMMIGILWNRMMIHSPYGRLLLKRMLLWPLVTPKSIETLHKKIMQDCDKIHPNHYSNKRGETETRTF
jgi:hypothetical protein